MRIQAKVLFVAFVLSLAVVVISDIYEYLAVIHGGSVPLPVAMSIFRSITALVIGPLLFFVAFYFIGKRIETTRDFYSYLLSFFIGNWVGATVALTIPMLAQTQPSFVPPSETVARFLRNLSVSAFSVNFFVGFSALAFSYILKKRQCPST